MIDKRINYRYGGDTMGGPNDRGGQGPAGGASSGGNYGGNQGGGNQGGGNQGGGGDGGAAARQAAAQRAMQQQIAQAEAQQAAQRAEADRQQRVAQQAAAEKAAAQKTATAGLRGDDPDLDKKAWDKIYQKQNEYLKTVDANTVSQLELDKIANDTLHQMYLGTGKPATQDYQNIFQTGAIHQTPGRTSITTGEGLGTINPFEQSGARTAIPTTPLRTRIQDDRAEDIRRKALGDIALQTDKSLIDISDPSGLGQGQGIMSGFADTGKSMVGNQLKKAATSFALSKLGLGFLNPFLGIASLFGYDPVGSLMAKMPKGTGTKTAWAGPNEEDLRGGDQNIVQASIEKFQPTDQQTAQMTELMRKRKILQGKADQGELNEKGMNTLAQMNQLIKQYQVDPRSIYG